MPYGQSKKVTLIKLFKYNTIAQIAVILFSVLVLWTGAFIRPSIPEPSHFYAPIYDLIQGWLVSFPRLASALALAIILFEGLWLNLLLSNHKMTSSNTLMPLFVYILAMSCDQTSLTITPQLFVNLFLIAEFSLLFADSAEPLHPDKNFYASACIGIASLVYLPALALLVAYLVVYVTYKLYNWRHLLIGLLGFLAPYIALLTYAFIENRLEYTLFLIRHDIGISFSPTLFSFNRISSEHIPCTLLVFFIVFLTFRELGMLKEKMVHQRINSWIMIYPLLAAAMMVYFAKTTSMQATAPTFAYLATVFFMIERRRKWIIELVMVLMILCFLFNLFYPKI